MSALNLCLWGGFTIINAGLWFGARHLCNQAQELLDEVVERRQP